MIGVCTHCEGIHEYAELSCCTNRIVSAIREHTRAMVAERLWAQAEAGTDVNHVVADADALLAALSASSGGDEAASGGPVASCEPGRPQRDIGRAGVAGIPGGTGARESLERDDLSQQQSAQAATPPLSADLVTVRRDDLRWALKWIQSHVQPTDLDIGCRAHFELLQAVGR